MTKSEKKNKRDVLEPKEREFFDEAESEIEELYIAIEKELANENFSVTEEKIEKYTSGSSDKLKALVIILVAYYYLKGVRKAEKQLGKGTLYTKDDLRHIDELLGSIYSNLDKIFLEYKQNILSAFSVKDRKISLEEVKKIKSRAIDRLKKLSGTESMKSRNLAMINTYKKHGGIYFIYWMATKDERLCSECAAMMDKIYPIEQWGLIPIHPYCRCFWKPVLRVEEFGRK